MGEQVATDADRCISYGEREVADRMDVPRDIGSRRESLGVAPLSPALHVSRALRPRIDLGGAFDRFGPMATSRS